MTSNQINYQKNLETARNNRVMEKLEGKKLEELKRSNLAKEIETERSNRAREYETHRSNVRDEDLRLMSNAITGDHFYRSDIETQRSNQAREDETHRSNVASEQHKESLLSADVEKHTIDKISAANKTAGAAYALGSRGTNFNISQLGNSILDMLGIDRKGSKSYTYDYTTSVELLPHYGSE